MLNGHISLSIKGGKSRIFASNLLISLSGFGHSMTPFGIDMRKLGTKIEQNLIETKKKKKTKSVAVLVI
jgi:hypothetical protein